VEIKLSDIKKDTKVSKVNKSVIGQTKKAVRIINLNSTQKVANTSIDVKQNSKQVESTTNSENKINVESTKENTIDSKPVTNSFNKLVQKNKDTSVKMHENSAKTVTIDLDDLENSNSRLNRKISPMHLKLYESSCFNVRIILF
jgi:hypothetical protein